MKILQLLPLNDSFLDPSPYNALSATALSPIYIRLTNLPQIPAHLRSSLQQFEPYKETKRVQYQEIYKLKETWLKDYANKRKESLLKEEMFQFFLNNQRGWLTPYALFKYFKQRFQLDYWRNWPKPYCNPTTHLIKTWAKELEEELFPYYAIQFFAYEQLTSVKKYAEKKGILLKGDIPILISPDSADVWSQPHLFHLDYAAGAPPDQFNPEGQYWGFPLYNWNALDQTHYSFWRQRLQFAEHFYDLFRIDHVIGFFRIWGVRRGFPASDGQFFPAKKSAMLLQGRHLLQMILSCSKMLPIAEDLGLIPDEARQILMDLGIPGTKVFRWERSYEEPVNYIPFNEYPPISMSCVSTHDSTPLGLWWQDDTYESIPFAKQKQWTYKRSLSTQLRKTILCEIHRSSSLFHINLFQEYLALLPELSWKKLEDDRINVPGYILPTNWTYRFKKSLHQLLECDLLFSHMREIVA